MRRTWILGFCLAACPGGNEDGNSGPSGGSITLTSASAPTTGAVDGTTGAGGATSAPGETGGEESTGGAAGSTSAGPGSSGGETTGAGLPPLACTYPSTNYAGAMLELKVPKGSVEQLVFTVPGLPPPEDVDEATLRFVSWDADHAGEEGVIVVNGGAPIDLPADAAWENAEHATAVTVTGSTVAGDNVVAFGAGSLAEGSFYRVGMVALDVTARVESCPEGPMTPPKSVQVDYTEATYTQRNNWVHRCDFMPPYAYTANGDHPNEDCDGLYMPDGSSEGTATFTFEDLAPALYKITIQSRHSANRNPKGALFIVDGEEKRVDQTSGSDVVVDEWGTKMLAGTITVVLDSSLDAESDSVSWVRVDPV